MTMEEYAIEKGKNLVGNQPYIYRYCESAHNFMNKFLTNGLLFNVNDDIRILCIGYYFNRFDKKLSVFIDRLIDYKGIDDTDNKITDYLVNMLKSNLLKIKDTLLKEYNPIDNYNSIEKENVSQKITNSDFNYGFQNINNPKNISKTINEGLFDDNKRVVEKSGNIGLTKTQDMINDEVNLRISKYYYDILFKEVDKLIFSKIY